jgi:hypothetical protein
MKMPLAQYIPCRVMADPMTYVCYHTLGLGPGKRHVLLTTTARRDMLRAHRALGRPGQT